MEKEGEKKDEQVRYGLVTNYEVDFGKVSQHFESQFCLLHAQAFRKFPSTNCVRRTKNALLIQIRVEIVWNSRSINE